MFGGGRGTKKTVWREKKKEGSGTTPFGKEDMGLPTLHIAILRKY